MVSNMLFTRVHRTKITRAHWLDHCFQTITFATDAHNYDADMSLHHHTLHGPEGQFLRWKPDKAADYVAHLEQDTPARRKLFRAIDNENMEQAWTCLKSWILESALRTGMTTSGTHMPKRQAQREKAAWFDDLCRLKKQVLQVLLNAVMKGGAPHIRDQLLPVLSVREYRAQTQRCKRRFKNNSTDPTVHKMLKKPAAKHVAPVSESSWCNHLHNVFRWEPVRQPATQTEQHRHVRQWTGTKSAMDTLIQPGRTTSRPTPFQHARRLMSCAIWSPPISDNISSPPGFEAITSTFIECACKRVPKQNERSWENVNVLVSHIAALFKLLMSKAYIPGLGKKQSLLPYTRRGQ